MDLKAMACLNKAVIMGRVYFRKLGMATQPHAENSPSMAEDDRV